MSEGVKTEIHKILPGFEEWLRSEDARNHVEKIVRRVREFRGLLSEENIERLTEPDFRSIITSLYAFIGWTNKDYVVDRVLASKDINSFALNPFYVGVYRFSHLSMHGNTDRWLC